MNKANDRVKYNQLRIKMKDLENRIKIQEKGKDTKQLAKLYRDRTELAKEISEVASRL